MVILHDVKPARRCAGGVALAVSGVLANAENSHLARSLARQLAESRVVVVDASRLRLHHGVTPTFFSNALMRAGGWPAVRLIVTGADPRLHAALVTCGAARDVLLVDDMAHAWAHAHHRPERVARRLHLSSAQVSVPRAIAVVDSAGIAWAAPASVIEDARRVVRELVDNAVRHARTASVLQVSADPAELRIAVRDFRVGGTGARGRGLGLVSSIATSWGVNPRSDGKSVWALLPPGHPSPET
jgi:hypothetical protein